MAVAGEVSTGRTCAKFSSFGLPVLNVLNVTDIAAVSDFRHEAADQTHTDTDHNRGTRIQVTP